MHKARVAFLTTYPDGVVRPFVEVAPPELFIYTVDNSLSDKEKAPRVKDADFIIVLPADISVELVRACHNLKLIQLFSAGYDRIDVKAISNLGIPVASNGGSNAVTVAEFTIALMLNVYKQFVRNIKSVAEEKWEAASWASSYNLEGKTVGIIGLGNIGRRVAARLRGFDVRLIHYDIVTVPAPIERDLGAPRVTLDELLRTSDIVTLHVPLTPQTCGLIGRGELSLMKNTAVLINTSRGAVVDEQALYEALRDKRIAAAALDVLKKEPMTLDNPLRGLDNVIITPHAASRSWDSRMDCASFAYKNMQRVLNGEEPNAVIRI